MIMTTDYNSGFISVQEGFACTDLPFFLCHNWQFMSDVSTQGDAASVVF